MVDVLLYSIDSSPGTGLKRILPGVRHTVLQAVGVFGLGCNLILLFVNFHPSNLSIADGVVLKPQLLHWSVSPFDICFVHLSVVMINVHTHTHTFTYMKAYFS